MSTSPVKVLALVPPRLSVPVTDVAPVTPNVKFPAVVNVPLLTERIPETNRFAAKVIVVVPVPETVKLFTVFGNALPVLWVAPL